MKNRHKKFHKRKRNLYLSIFLFLLVSVGIGYSIINSTVQLRGNLGIDKVTWNVHFDKPYVLSGGDLQTTGYTLNYDKTEITLDLNFLYPGDEFKLYVEVVNEGTIDAMFGSLNINGLTEEQKKLISYEVTYSDGTPIYSNDALLSGENIELLINVGYGLNLKASEYPKDDQSMNVSVSISYIQNKKDVSTKCNTLNTIMQRKSSLDSVVSKYVTESSGIKFNQVASSTNGKGVYVRSGTENNMYPIYYYRGSVNDNNVKFASMCWKIIRTTDTGGVKLIYNGIPLADGSCANTGELSQLDKVAFNNYTKSSIADAGYHYGTRYEVDSNAMLASLGWAYGNDVTYSNGTYTLVNTITTPLGWNSGHTSVNNGYHYTCLGTSTSCSTVYYIYYAGLTTASYFLPLSNGKMLNNVLNEMTINSSNASASNIKTYIETWYKNNLNLYTLKLEDTIWCNDRTIFNYNGWNKDTSAVLDMLQYGGYNRVINTFNPNLGCISKNDSFTVNNSLGNKLLNYPVGLITADEVIIASTGTGSYLYSGNPYWTMTPGYFAQDGSHNFFFDSLGLLSALRTVNSTVVGVRPVISLKYGLEVVDGSGSPADPYIIN